MRVSSLRRHLVLPDESDFLESSSQASEILERSFWEKTPTQSELVRLGFETDRWNMEAWRNMRGTWEVRSAFTSRYSFALPSKETIGVIKHFSTNLLEVGAGTGFWAWQLRKAGIAVIATNKPGPSGYKFKLGLYNPVVLMDSIKASLLWSDRDLLMIWPCYNRPWAADTLKYHQPGRYLFYIGESSGGCTGDDRFHEIINDPSQYDFVAFHEMSRFTAINDNLYIYRRKEYPKRKR
jgi:hypothetical protein